MKEINKQIIQTGFTLDRLHQDGKIDDEAYTILKDRNKQAINYTRCSTQLKSEKYISLDEFIQKQTEKIGDDKYLYRGVEHTYKQLEELRTSFINWQEETF